MFSFSALSDDMGLGAGHIAVLLWNKNGELVNHMLDDSCPDSNLAADDKYIYALSKLSYRIVKGLYVYSLDTLERISRYDFIDPGNILVTPDRIITYTKRKIRIIDKENFKPIFDVKTRFGEEINSLSAWKNLMLVTFLGKKGREIGIYTPNFERFKIIKSEGVVLAAACDGERVYGGVKNGKVVVWEL